MITGTCHCGAVKVEVPRRPRALTDCNCSICRRYGTLWAYYKGTDVTITGPTTAYAWGDKTLQFVRCRKCGCVMRWERIQPAPASRVGVNARNFEPAVIATARVRHLDGASTWRYLD